MKAKDRLSGTSIAVGLISFLSLFAGGWIYALARPGEAYFVRGVETLGLGMWIETLRSVTLPLSTALPEWMIFSLPNGLWAFSYSLVIVHIWHKRPTITGILCLASVPVVPVAYECWQYLRILPGTGCLVDVFLGLLGAGLGLYGAKHLQVRGGLAFPKERAAQWVTASFLVVMAAIAAGSEEWEDATPQKWTKETTKTPEGKTKIGWTSDQKNTLAEIGNTDREGRFQGEVERYFNGLKTESGPMKDGLRHGKWTEFNPQGTDVGVGWYLHGEGVTLESYLLYILTPTRLARQNGPVPTAGSSYAPASRIARMLEQRYPWVVWDMSNWGVDEETLDDLLISVEQFILQAQPKDRSDLIEAYDDAITAAVDSGLFPEACIVLNDIAAVQFQVEAKNFPLRLAIFGWYLDGGDSIYDVLVANYPEFLAQLISSGATSVEIKDFLDELEGHLSAMEPPDLSNPLLFDVLDQRIEAALELVDQKTHEDALIRMYLVLLLINWNSNPFLQATLESFYSLVWDLQCASHTSISFFSDTNTLYTLQATAQLGPSNWQNVPGAGPRSGIGGSDILTDTNTPPIGRFYRLAMQEP
jgi:hypothetical protein